jgi:hypothetical protein
MMNSSLVVTAAAAATAFVVLTALCPGTGLFEPRSSQTSKQSTSQITILAKQKKFKFRLNQNV